MTIKVPDNCELKQDGNTYTIVEKEKKITYEDIASKLFNYDAFYIKADGSIAHTTSLRDNDRTDANNCTSKKQAEKLLAINKLSDVAKYLNDGWQPDWDNFDDEKWSIKIEDDVIGVSSSDFQYGDIYFKSEKLAKQAIEILGEETVKTALCTNY